MKIGLIDVDNKENIANCYPNLALMKISSYYKNIGWDVEWCDPNKHYDAVFMSKVFSFSKDVEMDINADLIITGGSGYCIKLENGLEVFDSSKHYNLPDDIEHIYPDYSLYNIFDTAYGFMSRGCPRGCSFCYVQKKESAYSIKCADLNEFWSGQPYIELMDPNTLACKDWEDILTQLINSNSYVDFNQGLDIRLLTDDKLELLKRIKIRNLHFAYDRYADKSIIESRLESFKRNTNYNRSIVTVYVLVNYDTSIEEDLDRIMFIRSLNFQPYVMRYNKKFIKRGDPLNALARWVNNKQIFWSCDNFYKYLEESKRGLWH